MFKIIGEQTNIEQNYVKPCSERCDHISAKKKIYKREREKPKLLFVQIVTMPLEIPKLF